MIKLVAITGKMGSGKTEVLKIFNSKGYSTFSADKIYHELLLNEDFVEEISSALGVEPIVENDKKVLNKKQISQKVFSSKETLETLNRVTHPVIMKELFARISKCNGVVFCEIPLLQGSGYEDKFDVVIEVVKDAKESVANASIRDNLSEREIILRQKNQPKYENKCGITHIIINNDKSLKDLINMVSAVEKQIC